MKQPRVSLEDLPGIKAEYQKAVDSNKEFFVYENVEGEDCKFFVSYAKYLIEYLESRGANHEEKL